MSLTGPPPSRHTAGARDTAPIDLAHAADFRLGAIAVRPSSCEVVVGGVAERLEPRVMQVLVALARARGATVSRDDLFACCWDSRVVGEDAVNRVIGKLRRLSERDDGASFRIETLPRIGHRLFSADDPEADAPAGGEASPDPEFEAAAPDRREVDGRAPSPASPPLHRRRPMVMLALLLLVTLATFSGVYLARGGQWAQASTNLVAVLPFEDLSPGGDQAYFAEGVAEEILSDLASHRVKVLGRTSARRFAESGDVPALRKALGVTHVLEGSLRNAGGQTRVNVRLVQTSDGAQVWAAAFDRDAADIFAVQDQIGKAVAQELSGRLGGRRSEPLSAANAGTAEAYNLYLAGRARLRERTPAALAMAQALFERCVRLDPKSAAGWAALAETKALLLRRMAVTQGERFDRAQAEARGLAMQAIRLAPDRAEGYVALGQVERLEAPQLATAPLERALRLDPSRSDAHIWLGNAYIALGRYKEGLAQIRAAYAIDPLWFNANHNLVTTLSSFGLRDEAETVIARWEANAAQPDRTPALHTELALDRGDLSEALRWSLIPEAPAGSANSDLGQIYGALRLPALARTAVPADKATVLDLLHARDLAGMQRTVHEQGSGIWTVPGHAWMAAMLFNASARPDLTLALYRSRFPTPEAFCAWSEESPEVGAAFAYALIKGGDPAVARRVLDCSEPTIRRWLATGFMRGFNEIEMAQIRALRGDRAGALAGIERAVADGWIGQHTTLSDLRLLPAFESLSAEPRFRAAAARVDVAVMQEQRQALALIGPQPAARAS